MHNQTCFRCMFMALYLTTISVYLFGEEPNHNMVIVAGETWGTYMPANFDYDWPRYQIKTDVSQISVYEPQGSIFSTRRLVTSGEFGNPPWSWMASKIAMDFDNGLIAVEFNPSAEFAAMNTPIKDEENKHYAELKYVPTVAGADNPNRNYHDPIGGAYLSEDRSHTWATSAWPTTVGVDVKLTVHAWTMPWGHLDDFHLVEIELYNTGEPDLNGDGVIDVSNNKIQALNLVYWPGCFYLKIVEDGTRLYYSSGLQYRGFIIDLTPDENNSPWDITCQATGSIIGGALDRSGFSDMGGEYFDAYHGYGWLGAKKWNDATQNWEEKFLCFRDAEDQEKLPAVGVGAQRGWFRTSQPTWGIDLVNDERLLHIMGMGCFYVDGGKSDDLSALNLNPNPAIFTSGSDGDPTSFILKAPEAWVYPDGAWEKAEPVMYQDPVTGEAVGISPVDPNGDRGQALEPDIITQGLITQYEFDGEPVCALGPFAMEVGERIRLYFYRGSGFRMNGLRKTVKMARAVFEAIESDGSYQIPQAPPVPEIKVTQTSDLKPFVKWQNPADLGVIDGIKIYRSGSYPEYNSTEKLYPTHDTWWKTMDPAVDPGKSEINPLFMATDMLVDQAGGYWGPYELVKVISVSEFDDFQNQDRDAAEYPFAWTDENEFHAGQSLWYYVASYQVGAAQQVPTPFQGLDETDWLESGKVNVNGRTGQWENTWPWATEHAWFPDSPVGLKKLGAALVLTSNKPTDARAQVSTSQVTFGETRLGDIILFSDKITVENRGFADLTIDSIAVPEGFQIDLLPADFPIRLTPPGGLTPQKQFSVFFEPIMTGAFNKELTIYHSDADTSVLKIALTGNCVQVPNKLTGTNRWYQFGLAGRSCAIVGKSPASDTLYTYDAQKHICFMTDDGGGTWNTLPVNRPADAEQVYQDGLLHPEFTFDEKIVFDSNNYLRFYYEYICEKPEGMLSQTFRSDDQGQSWTEMFPGQDALNSITNLQYSQILSAVDNPARIYRCADDFLLVSDNTGLDWREIKPGILAARLVTGSAVGDGVCCFNSQYLVRSNDAGATWQKSPKFSGDCYQLIAAPDNPDVLFGLFNLQGQTKILTSLDAGSTWHEKSLGISPDTRIQAPFPPLFINPANENEIIFSASVLNTADNLLWSPVYWSSDHGEMWHLFDTDWHPFVAQIARYLNNFWLSTQKDATMIYAATTDGIFKLKTASAPVLVDTEIAARPETWQLFPNYPNPFNPTTHIRYQLPEPERVHISIYNLLGQKIKTLVNEKKLAGQFLITWDGKDDTQHEVANGIYICRMITGRYNQEIKLVFLK